MTPIVSGRQLIFDQKYLMAMIFNKNSSKNYGAVVQLCKTAFYYSEDVEKNGFDHLTIFGQWPIEAERAIATLELVDGWKTAKFFVGGRLQWNSFSVKQTLQCYAESTRCTDPKAHCHEVIQSPYLPKMNLGMFMKAIFASSNPEKPFEEVEDLQLKYREDKYVFPCKKMLRNNFRIDVDHPSSLSDQIQAGAIKHGCDSCPNFNPKALGLVPRTFWKYI